MTPNRSWQLPGNRPLVLSIAEHGDSAVAALVECLDRTELARATIKGGDRALVGAVCGHILHEIAYSTAHETDGNWAGVVYPSATAGELREAKKEWLRVLSAGHYRLSMRPHN